MTIEALKRTLLESLSSVELAARQAILRDIGEEADQERLRRSMNEHRRAAFREIDVILERGEITGSEAERRKAMWDIRNGF